MPELLKVGIADKVSEHAKNMGFTQTPTLNASISGNIVLAMRQADPPPIQAEVAPANEELYSRITRLRDIPDMFDSAYLSDVIQHFSAATKADFERENDFLGTISVGPPIMASDIPSGMHRKVVGFAQDQGFQSRHSLDRWEENEEVPYLLSMGAMASSLFPTQKKRRVHYDISQPSTLPASAAILEVSGDGRCVPKVKVLLYVLPLQLTNCLLVSSFRHNWPPQEDHLEFLCHSNLVLKPDPTSTTAGIAVLVPFAVKRTMDAIRQCVVNRVNQLEKELK